MKPIYIYLAPFFPSPNSWRGGFFYDFVKAIIRDGHYDVRVMIPGDGKDYEYNGIKVFSFRQKKIGCSDYLSPLTDNLKKISFAHKLRDMGLSPRDINVCHVNLVERMCFYASWIKNRNPVCFTFAHHHWSGLYGYPGGYVAKFPLVRLIEYCRIQKDYKTIDAHVFCSEQTKKSFGQMFRDECFANGEDLRNSLPFHQMLPELSFRDAAVFYNGVDYGLFHVSNEISSNKQRYLVGCVANFNESKSQMTLIDAFAKVCGEMPGAELIFVGSGLTLPACRGKVAYYGLEDKISFVVEMDHKNLPTFYNSLSLFVLPSYFEAFNCSIIEAWACGVPCIATDAISFKEVLPREEWDKWLFPAKDANALAHKLLWAYTTRPNRQELFIDLNINAIARQFLRWIETQN